MNKSLSLDGTLCKQSQRAFVRAFALNSIENLRLAISDLGESMAMLSEHDQQAITGELPLETMLMLSSSVDHGSIRRIVLKWGDTAKQLWSDQGAL